MSMEMITPMEGLTFSNETGRGADNQFYTSLRPLNSDKAYRNTVRYSALREVDGPFHVKMCIDTTPPPAVSHQRYFYVQFQFFGHTMGEPELRPEYRKNSCSLCECHVIKIYIMIIISNPLWNLLELNGILPQIQSSLKFLLFFQRFFFSESEEASEITAFLSHMEYF